MAVATSADHLLSDELIMDERDLVQRVLSKDPRALKELIRTYERLVGHMVGRLIDHDQDREEVCQDVFIKVFDQLNTFKFDSKLSTWIATISYRLAVNYLKRQKRSPDDQELDQVAFQYGVEDRSFEQRDYSAFIRSLIDQMPLNYRAVLTLYHLEGFSYPEIVQVMEMPEGTVKNYLFRARKKLKELSVPYIGKEIHEL